MFILKHLKTLQHVSIIVQIIFRELVCSLLKSLILKFVKNVKSVTLRRNIWAPWRWSKHVGEFLSEWEVCQNGKPTDGNGVQATHQRERMNGKQCEGKLALVVGQDCSGTYAWTVGSIRYRHLCSFFGMWIIGVQTGLNWIYGKW